MVRYGHQGNAVPVMGDDMYVLRREKRDPESAGLALITVELMLWVSGTMSAVVICGAAFGWR
jgi:hypothetical protein